MQRKAVVLLPWGDYSINIQVIFTAGLKHTKKDKNKCIEHQCLFTLYSKKKNICNKCFFLFDQFVMLALHSFQTTIFFGIHTFQNLLVFTFRACAALRTKIDSDSVFSMLHLIFYHSCCIPYQNSCSCLYKHTVSIVQIYKIGHNDRPFFFVI